MRLPFTSLGNGENNISFYIIIFRIMATKIIRLVSDQTGPWNPAGNTVDITIPSYISYTDMTRSCIVLNMYLQKNDGTAKLGVVQDAAFNNGLDARALLKTVTVANDQGGD